MRLTALAALFLANAALAQDGRELPPVDARVRTLTYLAGQTPELKVASDVDLTVLFPLGERVRSVQVGDPSTFSTALSRESDGVVIRILRPSEGTSLAVSTDRRNYEFGLVPAYDRVSPRLIQIASDEQETGASAASASAAARQDLNDVPALLREAVRQRRNILISGGTSSGKTTLLNTLLAEIPQDERLITIEDTPELQIPHANAVGLIAARGAMGEAQVSTEDLLIASLRMRPDRIILGEIRGSEALSFLRTINTGHPGSLSTIHANSPMRAIDQLALLVLQAGARMHWDDGVTYVRRSVDIIVQLQRGNRGRCGRKNDRDTEAAMVRGPSARALGPRQAGKHRAMAGPALRSFERLHAGPAFTKDDQRRDRRWSESAAGGGQSFCHQHLLLKSAATWRNDRNGAQSRPASLRDTNGGFQQEPPLTSTTLNVLSWSQAAPPHLRAVPLRTAAYRNCSPDSGQSPSSKIPAILPGPSR